jgi:hypothetical protein
LSFKAAVDLFILTLFNCQVSSLKALNLGHSYHSYTYLSRLLYMMDLFKDASVYSTRSYFRVLDSEGLQIYRFFVTMAPIPSAIAEKCLQDIYE